MNEAEIKLETRLQASEFLLCNLYAKRYLEFPDPVNAVIRGKESVIAHLRSATGPGVDPALSDLGAGELGDAIEGLLSTIIEMVERATGSGSNGSEVP